MLQPPRSALRAAGTPLVIVSIATQSRTPQRIDPVRRSLKGTTNMKILGLALLTASTSLISAGARADSWPATSTQAMPPAQETVMGSPRVSGWYLAPTTAFTTLAGDRAFATGLRGAVMFNQRFGLGLAGNIMTTSQTRLSDDQVRHIGGYGGLYLQYVLQSNRLVHAYADATLGSGSFCVQSVGDDCATRDFAFAEPTLNLEVNLARHLRFAAGVGYRAAIADDGPGFDSGDLSGVVVRTSLVLGAF
jgi:hypothetical protein